MIQDIAPYVLDNQYTPDLPNKDSFLLCFHGNEVLINISDDQIVFPRLKDLESMEENLQEGCTYLFSINSQSFYLANNIANYLFQHILFQNGLNLKLFEKIPFLDFKHHGFVRDLTNHKGASACFHT